jgi:hypothetical protein
VRLDGEAQARLFKKNNNKLHSSLVITKVHWLRNFELYNKTATSIILEVDSATQANRLIIKNIIYQYELKTVEFYNSVNKIRQYFNCQQYAGHISLYYKNETKCGYCGDKHVTKKCSVKEYTTRRTCAACKQSDYFL